MVPCPRLGIRFAWKRSEGLTLYYPDGRRFLSFQELSAQAKLAEQRAEQERQRADQLAEYLRSLGIDPEQI